MSHNKNVKEGNREKVKKKKFCDKKPGRSTIKPIFCVKQLNREV